MHMSLSSISNNVIYANKVSCHISSRNKTCDIFIDVLEVEGVYYGFSGCHRFEAHQRLGLPTIRCKIRRGTKETLRHHLR
ncbi:unnamed protein product [Ilex paraguariensis]|uniref:sulfiredoxin n=1 Tax=Ilex paraguariensis TaxID=185542 RepID=A0ABC8V1B4_9AQUA